jgi:hypothetical protein
MQVQNDLICDILTPVLSQEGRQAPALDPREHGQDVSHDQSRSRLIDFDVAPDFSFVALEPEKLGSEQVGSVGFG